MTIMESTVDLVLCITANRSVVLSTCNIRHVLINNRASHRPNKQWKNIQYTYCLVITFVRSLAFSTFVILNYVIYWMKES